MNTNMKEKIGKNSSVYKKRYFALLSGLYFNNTLMNSFPQHHINHAILYNQFYLPFQYDETLSIWYSRWFTCRLRFFSWLLDLVIYLKLRKQLLLLQVEKLTKWQLFSPRTILSEKGVIVWISSLTLSLFFSAWDQSHDPTVNWSLS